VEKALYSRVYTSEFGTRIWEGIFYSEHVFGLHEARHSDMAYVKLFPTGAQVATYSSVGGDYDLRIMHVKREHVLESYKRRHTEPPSPEALAKEAIGMLCGRLPPVVKRITPAFVQRLLQMGREWR
jgi:hypothetical protein